MGVKKLYVYDELTEEVQKQWLTLGQVSECHRRELSETYRLIDMEKSHSVRKKYMVTQSEEYGYHIKNKNTNFHGKHYDVELFYNREDVSKYVETIDEITYLKRDRDLMRGKSELKDLRSYLNDVRNVKAKPYLAGSVRFYGENVKAIKHIDKGTQFRMWYSLFLNKELITQLTAKLHNINNNSLEFLTFLYVYQFFIPLDTYHYARIHNTFWLEGETFRGIRKTIPFFEKKGYIECVEIPKERGAKKYKKSTYRKLYTTTPKTDKIVQDYMDYMMYKKKVPFLGSSRNGQRLTVYDIKYYHEKDAMKRGIMSPVPYMFYEYCYDYINYKSDVELFDGNMKEFMKKSKSKQLYFNSMVYKIAQQQLVASGGKDENDKYIETFLNNRRWGSKI